MNFKTFSTIGSFGLAALLWLGAAASSKADLVLGSSSLDGFQPSTPTGSLGLGVGILNLDTTTGLYDFSLFVSGISAGDLQGLGPNLSPIHFHKGAPGVDGPIVVDAGYAGTITPIGSLGFKLDVTGGTFGGVQGGLIGPSVGDNLADLIQGMLYINIHTVGFPGGEIRGQLVTAVVPEPTSLALGLMGLCALGTFLYRRHAHPVS